MHQTIGLESTLPLELPAHLLQVEQEALAAEHIQEQTHIYREAHQTPQRQRPTMVQAAEAETQARPLIHPAQEAQAGLSISNIQAQTAAAEPAVKSFSSIV